jgi:hypothetical protein
LAALFASPAHAMLSSDLCPMHVQIFLYEIIFAQSGWVGNGPFREPGPGFKKGFVRRDAHPPFDLGDMLNGAVEPLLNRTSRRREWRRYR